MSYFRLATSRALTETNKFWNIHQIWAFCSVPIVGFLLHALIRKSRLSGWQEVALFAVFGFIVAWLGSYMINLIHVPAILHHEQAQVMVGLETDKSLLQEAMNAHTELVNRLNFEVEDLKKPKRSALEEKTYQSVKATLEKYGEDEKTLLRHLRMHGKIKQHHSMGLGPLPAGFSQDRVTLILNKLVEDDLVTREFIQRPTTFEHLWQIATGAKSALEELL